MVCWTVLAVEQHRLQRRGDMYRPSLGGSMAHRNQLWRNMQALEVNQVLHDAHV